MATLDILTRAEGYRAVNNTTAADSGIGKHDEAIEQAITKVSLRVDEIIGPVVIRTVTEEHRASGSIIRPRKTPVSSVTTVKEWDGSSLTTLTEDTFGVAGNANGFKLVKSGAYAHDHKLERRSSGTVASFSGEVQVVYEAGRAADTDSVDARIKGTVASILGSIWKREGGVWAQSSDLLSNLEGQATTGFWNAVDRRIEEMLHDETKPIPVA